MSEIRYNRSIIPEENQDFEFRNKEAYIIFNVKSKEYVKKGTIIGSIYNYKFYPTESFYVFSDIDGIVTYPAVNTNQFLGTPKLVRFNDVLFEITPLQEFIEHHKPICHISSDPFNGGNKLDWLQYKGFSITYWDSISFEYLNGLPQLSIGFDPKEHVIKTKDSLSFLFDDGSVRTLKIEKAPIRQQNGHGKQILLPLTESDLNSFCDRKLVSLRFNTEDNQKHFEIKIESCDDACCKAEIGQLILQNFALEMRNALCKMGHKWVITSKIAEECFVYLMEDTANGYHKIGISNHPEYREGTLQSEKPTIELICAKRYPSRLIASAIESSLHKAFENKHIRGEWFDLTLEDVKDIILTLQ